MRVINLLPHGPAYHVLSEEKQPLAEWKRRDGAQLAIVNREWPGELGRWVLATSAAYSWEVWQLDPRADAIYTYEFEDGVIHRLLPAVERVYRPGLLRPVSGIWSSAVFDLLREVSTEPLALILHGFGVPYWYELLDRLYQDHSFPILLVGHGNSAAPIQRLREAKHPLTFPACVVEQVRAKRRYRRLDAITEQNDQSLSAARSVYGGYVERLTMGADFGFWTPAPDEATRGAARAALDISPGRTVFLSAAVFGRRKQLDHLITAFCELKDRTDFTLLIAGQGDESYTAYLRSLAAPLLSGRKVIFYPYATGEMLRRLHWAADLFVSASTSEGASVAVMEAIGTGLPVISTPVGGTYEAMERFGAGRVLPVRDYGRWPDVFRSVLEKGPPPALDRDRARSEFDWRAVAARFVAVLEKLRAQYRFPNTEVRVS